MLGRPYRIQPTVAAITAAATNKKLLILTPAANKLVLVRSMVVSQRGNNDNETWSVAIREIATPGGGDSFTAIEPVDPGDPSAGFTVAVDNGTTITGTSGNIIAKRGGHVQGPLHFVPTDTSGVLMVCSANRVLLIQCDNAPATSATTPIIDLLVEEVGA